MYRLYHYVGPPEIRERVSKQPPGRVVSSAADVVRWIEDTEQAPGAERYYLATFVVDHEGALRIEDYGHEHVSCAGGGPVRSAGVAWFDVEGAVVEVAKVSNQSTGFCPEPTSWPAVEESLEAAGLEHPGEFTQPIVFRLCPHCGQRNIVKDEWYYCGVCDGELPADWNFPSQRTA